MAEHKHQKVRGRPRVAKPPIRPLREDQTIRPLITSREAAGLGKLVMAWNVVEANLQGVIWAFLNISFEEGRVITGKMDSTNLIQTTRAIGGANLLSSRLQNFLDMMNVLDELREIRNLAVHGVWSRLMPENVPTVSSLRIKIDLDQGDVGSETFSRQRLEELVEAMHMVAARLSFLEGELITTPDRWLKPR